MFKIRANLLPEIVYTYTNNKKQIKKRPRLFNVYTFFASLRNLNDGANENIGAHR